MDEGVPFEFVSVGEAPGSADVRAAPVPQIRRGAARYPCCMTQAVPTYSRHVSEGLKPTLKGLGGCEMSSFRTRCSAD